MALAIHLARAPVRLQAAVLPRRQIYTTPIVSAKKNKSKPVVDNLFDDEEQWGAVEDLIPSTPQPSPKPSVAPAVASTSSLPPAKTTVQKAYTGGLTPGQRLHKFNLLAGWTKPRIGRHPTKKSPLVRRTVFPQLIQLSTTPEHLQKISELMVTWKEGRLGTQGKARFGPDGKPKGAHPFSESTSELFARRCEELGVPEHALMVYGEFAKYALPLTLPAARRLLHGLIAKGRPSTDITTAASLYESHGLPPIAQDMPSCALLLSACLRTLETAQGNERLRTRALTLSLIDSLQSELQNTPPMPASRNVQEKTLRRWLKDIMFGVETPMKEEDATSPTLDSPHPFRSQISQFSYVASEPRRSPRKPCPVKRLASESSPKKRRMSPVKRVKEESESKPSRSPSPKKLKRGYAPPEAYAHLHELQDHLKPDLDVIFCGINPGKKSAEIGHHFGSPSNHFWWQVSSPLLLEVVPVQTLVIGFTETKLPPHDDYTLPDRYSLGLTNLVDRPTSEQNELSAAEQLASVPTFLAKVQRFRPGIVCFVGISIAKVVDKSLKVTLGADAESWGLRPYKMVHENPTRFNETLFFAAPSTSGLVIQYQRDSKAEIFGELRQLVQKFKDGTLQTTDMTVIQPHQIAPAVTPHKMLGFPRPPKVEEGNQEQLLQGLLVIQSPSCEGPL
ncbi:UDG domain-containing protein [Favolaschia claudopus]|uniref:UDG domain-containing protein n=1 Tax=Favolaschia claudopus TaxID=2862362 RepID=A0AAW0B5M5_9AGAR